MRTAEEKKTYNIEYRKRNLERLKEYDRNRPNRLQRNARQNEYYHKDKNRHRQWRQEHYRKNRDRILSRRREQEKWANRSQKQKEATLAYTKAYRAAHPAKRREYFRRWKEKYPDRYRRHWETGNAVRRAKTNNVTVNPRSIELFISGVRAKAKVRCYYCGEWVNGKKAHIDHIVALSRGGAHSVENLCASCPHCNLSKHNTPIQDWMRLGQQVLAL